MDTETLRMPPLIIKYVHLVDSLNRVIGRLAMLLIFAMIGILLYSSITKTFFLPSLWTLEMAQFVMVAYYLLGGGYSMQLDSHVRMDLVYGRWSSRTSGGCRMPSPSNSARWPIRTTAERNQTRRIPRNFP